MTAGRGAQVCGLSLALSLLIEGDPTIEVALAPAVRWAEEVWAAACGDPWALQLTTLRKHWQGAQCKRPGRWGQVRGPLGAAALTLRRLGWAWNSAFVFTSPQGHQCELTAWAPAAIKKLLVRAEQARQEQRAAANLKEAGARTRPMAVWGPLG